MAFITFDFGFGTHHNTATSGLISLANTLYTIYICTSREVWRFDILHQSIKFNIGIINVSTATINHLSKVVSRYIGSHTHGNTVSTIDQKIRNLRRHDTRFNERIIEVVGHVYGILLQVVHNVLTHLAESALRVTHGSRRVTVNRAEVTLSVDQRIAHIPVLSHANKGTIDRRVTMRVILTEHLTYYAGTLLIRFVTGIADTQHTVKNTTMNRFETVSDIRKRTSYNHRHRIVDVRRLHFFLNVDFQNSVIVNCLIFVH